MNKPAIYTGLTAAAIVAALELGGTTSPTWRESASLPGES